MKKDMRTDKQKEYEEKMYHNTEILLKRYRDVVWSMEVSAIQARMNFDRYEKEVDVSLKRITSLIEPIMIVVVGILAGTVVISIFLPMFEMTSNMGI